MIFYIEAWQQTVYVFVLYRDIGNIWPDLVPAQKGIVINDTHMCVSTLYFVLLNYSTSQTNEDDTKSQIKSRMEFQREAGSGIYYLYCGGVMHQSVC